jgi:two-component system NtrC family sensor kinase
VEIMLTGAARFAIEITDTGVGISPENLGRIFTFGFSTKPGGHGFGLHSSAIAMAEMGGTLTAHSEGRGKGARFRIELPLRQPGGNTGEFSALGTPPPEPM